MAEIDHHLCWQACFVQPFFHFSNVLRAVVRLFTAAQNDMAIAVTAGIHNRRMPPFRYGQEAVRRTGGINGIDSHFNRTISAIFETYRTRKTRRQFAVHLRFGGTCANCAPAHQVSEILWGDHIEKLTCRWQTAVVNIKQQFTGYTQTVVDLEAIIHMRIVNQPFPAHRGTRLFKIDAHYDFQLIFQLFTQRQQASGILFCRDRIMN